MVEKTSMVKKTKETEKTKMKYVKIILDDTIGGGSEYQWNCIKYEAKKIGLEAKLINSETGEIIETFPELKMKESELKSNLKSDLSEAEKFVPKEKKSQWKKDRNDIIGQLLKGL